MTSLFSYFVSPGVRRALSLSIAACALSSVSFSQTETPTPPSEAAAPAGRVRRDQNGDGNGRGNFNPEDMQKRLMANLREQFGVADDEEWKLISERITKVAEVRRNALGGFGGIRGGNRPGRQGSTGNPEQDALRQAVADKLPDAEIKARLERLREARKANEEKLGKAQEELRAVLSVRQEAVAVLNGLLP